MRITRLCIFVLIAIVSFARAAEESEMRASKPEVRKEIVATIDGQLAAFRKQDVARAYAFAATALQRQKPLPIFAAIVRTSYPEIWASTHAECGIVRDDGRTATVLVHVFAKDGDAAYDYTLVKEAGHWRISGVLRHEAVKEEKV